VKFPKVSSNIELPDEFRSPEEFIEKCLTDLFYFCKYVLRHGKKEEYRDLNHIHMQLCDVIQQLGISIFQLLVLMSRDSLKSTIGRAFIIQQLLKHAYYRLEGLLAIITGKSDLAEEHMGIISREFFRNEMIQAFFAHHAKCIPRKKSDADTWKEGKIRFGTTGVDMGSPRNSLSGIHYPGVWTDNFMNEVNSRTSQTRKTARDFWKSQESLIKENGWEMLSETPWEKDDVSGEVLDPEMKFDYRKIYRKSPAIFVSETGYTVFSCGARNEKGEPNFPFKLDETYLKRKRIKQGKHLYNRMYELLPMTKEEMILDIPNAKYKKLPYNFIRNIAVDCAGTKAKHSSHSAVSTMDWDETGYGHLSYAKKKKISPWELFTWVCNKWDKSEEEGRPCTYMIIEREKYGIFLADLLETKRPDICVFPVNLRGQSRGGTGGRMMELVPKLEQNRILIPEQGLPQYEDEKNEYTLDKDTNVDILDTIWLHLQGAIIPNKLPKGEEFLEDIPDDFTKQLEKERMIGEHRRQQISARF
jgi:hypothetical protein